MSLHAVPAPRAAGVASELGLRPRRPVVDTGFLSLASVRPSSGTPLRPAFVGMKNPRARAAARPLHRAAVAAFHPFPTLAEDVFPYRRPFSFCPSVFPLSPHWPVSSARRPPCSCVSPQFWPVFAACRVWAVALFPPPRPVRPVRLRRGLPPPQPPRRMRCCNVWVRLLQALARHRFPPCASATGPMSWP